MRLGFGIYRHQLTSENLAFARQAGATDVVVHLVDYFRGQGPGTDQPIGAETGWGIASGPETAWTLTELQSIRRTIEDHGLRWYAIENFDPGHWHDVLLDGPRRREQIEGLKDMVRAVGACGIPVIGYNFSLAGVAGRITGPFARGGAISVGMDGVDQTPIPEGMVWNMTYAPQPLGKTLASTTSDELWSRCKRFLEDVLPVAEEAGVRLAAHPDDPPVPELRGQPRLIHQPSQFRRLLNLRESDSNTIEFCLGTASEMTEHGLYEVVDDLSASGRIAYVHFRNVRGKVPHYHETFIDEGDTDMIRILKILRRNAFDGVLIPDHAPQMAGAAPWHEGMAFAMGYMRGALQALDSGTSDS